MLENNTCVNFLDTQGELFEILEDDKCLPEEQVQAIAKQLVISSFTSIHLSVPLF